MNVICKKPKLWWLLKLFFPKYNANLNAVTWGNTCYVPQGLNRDTLLKDALLAHEEVHTAQQHHSNIYAIWYFAKYLMLPDFRYKMELEGVKVHYKMLVGTKYDSEAFARQMAKDFSNGLYRTKISYQQALRDITE